MRREALAAVRTLLRYIGEDPTRDGLLETPDRVLRAYGEFFAGYAQDPTVVLAKTFDETAGYNGPVVVRDIAVHSHCEHHLVTFNGVAHVAYLPQGQVVGLSKLARLVEVFARRLQIQERLTAQIAGALQTYLRPRGVAVMIAAEHQCMTLRGVRQHDTETVTLHLTGVYESDPSLRSEIIARLGAN